MLLVFMFILKESKLDPILTHDHTFLSIGDIFRKVEQAFPQAKARISDKPLPIDVATDN